MMVGGLLVVPVDNPIEPPAHEDRSIIGWGNVDQAAGALTLERARFDAVNLWNEATVRVQKTGNFVQETRNIFRKFQAIIKRRAFLERRIHRFLKEQARILLPSHRRFLFDHELRCGNEVRKADFILEREAGLPALFIELESPIHKVFQKNGEFTKEVNHAKHQIAEWISFIERESNINASGEMAFLAGPKQRLVVIGRGLEVREKLLNTKFTDTIIWTYELLLEEARTRWNDEIETQYGIVGLPKQRPF